MKRGWIRAHASGACLFQASAAGFALVLSGCATPPGPADPAAGDSRAMRLAGMLEAAARSGDPRLEDAEAELRALEAVLTGPVSDPAATTRSEPVPEPEPVPLPPSPDVSRMVRVFHGVHIASYRSRELALSGWEIYRQNPALAGLEALTAEVELDSGRWYRLMAGPFDTRGAASALCAELEARGDWCAVTAFNGAALAR